MDNLNQIEKFRNLLIHIINNSNLSLGITYYVFKDIYNELTNSYKYYLSRENEDKKQFDKNIEIDIDGDNINSQLKQLTEDIIPFNDIQEEKENG